MSTLLEMRIDELEEQNAALIAERDALAAQVGVISKATQPERIIDHGHCHACADKVFHDDYYSKIDGKLYHDGCISESAKHKGGLAKDYAAKRQEGAK